MATGNSLCPHLLQEYFKRVEEIIVVYKPQLKFIKYEDISGSLLSRKIFRHEEHEAIQRLKSEESKMDVTLDILQKRMWGFENLVTVLIEKHVDSWLVEEMFEKYVHHIVNEIRRQQALRDCRCFEHEKRSIIRRAVIRFFEKCDKWLFEIGTSIGFVTMSIYPTHNSLQFINNWFPIPRKTDMDEMLSLPSIEYTPFEYKNDLHHANDVEIIEVATDSERSSSSSSGSSSGGSKSKATEVEEKRKSVPSSPSNKMKKTMGHSSPTRSQIISGNRSNSMSSSSTTKKIPTRSSQAVPLTKSTRAVSPTIPLPLSSSSIKVQDHEPEKMTEELSSKLDPVQNEEEIKTLVTSASGSISTSPPLPENNSTDYSSSLVFLPMRLQLPTKLGSTGQSTAFLSNNENTNTNDNNTNCFILSSIPINEMMRGSKSNNASALENIESTSSAAAVVVANPKNLAIISPPPPCSSETTTTVLTTQSVQNEQNINVDKLNDMKKKTSSRKVLTRPSRIPSVKSKPEPTKMASVSSKKTPEVPSAKKLSLEPTSGKNRINSEAGGDDEEDEVFVDAQPFLENSHGVDHPVNVETMTTINPTIQCADLKKGHQEDHSEDKNTQADIPNLVTPVIKQNSSSSATEEAATEMTRKKNVVSINGRLVEKKIPSSRIGKKNSVSTDPPKPNKLLSASPRMISKTNDSLPSKIIDLSIGKDNHSDTISSHASKTRISTTRRPVKVPTTTRVNKEKVVELLTPEVDKVDDKDKSSLQSTKTGNNNDDDCEEKLVQPSGALVLSSTNRESDFSEGKENQNNTQQCPDSNKKNNSKVSSLFTCKTNQEASTKKSMLIGQIEKSEKIKKSKMDTGEMVNQKDEEKVAKKTKEIAEVGQQVKPQTVKNLNNKNDKSAIIPTTTTTPIKILSTRSKSLSEKFSTSSNKMADGSSRTRVKSLGTSKLSSIHKGTVKALPDAVKSNKDSSPSEKNIKVSKVFKSNSSNTQENDSGLSSSEQLSFDISPATTTSAPLVHHDQTTEEKVQSCSSRMTSTIEQQTCMDSNISEEQLLLLLSPHLTPVDAPTIKIEKRNSCPCLNEIKFEQEPKILVEKNIKKIRRSKSESKLYSDSIKTLPEQVGNMLEQLSMELLSKIWKKIQQDCSASLEHEMKAEEAILNLTKSASGSQSSSTGQLDGPNVKVLVDASSQTVLKMKSISQTASSPPPPTSSPTIHPSVTPKSSENKLDSRKKTSSFPTTNGKLINPKSPTVVSPTNNNNISADPTKVRPKVNPTPVKPVWSNKKPTPAPLMTSDRYSIFSSDDYNFQLWANEWACRQDKKKTEEENRSNNNV